MVLLRLHSATPPISKPAMMASGRVRSEAITKLRPRMSLMQDTSGLVVGSLRKPTATLMAQEWLVTPCPIPGNWKKKLWLKVSAVCCPQDGGVMGSYSPLRISVGISLITGDRLNEEGGTFHN